MYEQIHSPEIFRKLLRYEPQTGKLFWRVRGPEFFADGWKTAQGTANNWNARWAGKEAFTSVNTHGYRQGSILNKVHPGHRVAWMVHSGKLIDGQIDHINGDRCDNRLLNLRVVTPQENAMNRSNRSDNTSGCLGVYWHPSTQKWRARIKVMGKLKSLGLFAEKIDAICARKDAEKKYGFHINHGR